MLSSTAKTVGRPQRKWTKAEDQKLREQVEFQMSEGEVKDWCRVAAKLPGRTNKDCRKRWYNSVIEGLKKGQWSKAEDIQLRRGVEQYGQKWTLVANIVGSRSADQCAKRFQQSLDPGLDHSEWCDAEDRVLIEAVQKSGRGWKDIQRHHFAARSKNCIKNRYTVLVRRYQNQGITLPLPRTSREPSTSPSPTDEDDMSCTPSFHHNFQQMSTPHHPWLAESEQCSGWPSQDPWIWPTASSINQPVIMDNPLQSGYFPVRNSATLAAYDAYGGIPAMLGPSPTHLPGSHVRGPARTTMTLPFQDPQRDPSFQY